MMNWGNQVQSKHKINYIGTTYEGSGWVISVSWGKATRVFKTGAQYTGLFVNAGQRWDPVDTSFKFSEHQRLVRWQVDRLLVERRLTPYFENAEVKLYERLFNLQQHQVDDLAIMGQR